MTALLSIPLTFQSIRKPHMKAAVAMLCSEAILTRLLLPRLALACSCVVACSFSMRTHYLLVQKADQRFGRDPVVTEMSQKTCSAREVI